MLPGWETRENREIYMFALKVARGLICKVRVRAHTQMYSKTRVSVTREDGNFGEANLAN